MRVAVVSRWYPGPQDERAGLFVRDQVEILCTRVAVDVLVPRELPARRFVATRLQLPEFALPPPGPFGRLLRTRLFARALSQLPPPSLVHVHLILPDALPVIRWCTPRGIPVVVTEHAGYLPDLLAQPQSRAQAREVLQRAAAVVAVGTRVRTWLQDVDPEARIEVIGNVVDTAFFTPGVEPRRGAVTVAPTLDEQKGIDLLLRAWREIDEPLVLVGADPGGRMHALARELGVDARVRFRGSVSREELRDSLRGARVYVCASRAETFGVAVAEALACGTPAVSTRCGGPEDFVDDEAGVLVPLGDEAALARAVRSVLESDEYRANRLHASLARRFGPAAFLERMLALYGDVTGAAYD